MKKLYFIGVAIVIILAAFLLVNNVAKAGPTTPSVVASSTTYTLTTTSQRLIATSSQRTALAVQPTNCTGGANTSVFLKLEGVGDVAATANDGFAVMSSTTARFSDYDEFPTPQNAVRGITGVGTCTVLVTEWIVR